MNVLPSARLAAFGSVLATGLLCLSLTGCGGHSTPSAHSGGTLPAAGSPTSQPPAASPGAGPSHPCALLTQAEAAAAVGQPVNAGVENAPLGMCTYASADFAAGADLTVSTWDSMVAAANGGNGPPSPVSGVGDQALNHNGAGGSLLYVRKGTAGFLLTLDSPTIQHLPDHGLAKEEAVAALILPRL